MKHVCPCRACGGAVSIHKEHDRLYGLVPGGYTKLTSYHYWYQCECGVKSGQADKKSLARHFWNSANAEAQNMRELTHAINALAAKGEG